MKAFCFLAACQSMVSPVTNGMSSSVLRRRDKNDHTTNSASVKTELQSTCGESKAEVQH